jgi:DHA1 family inner membrane transport protein
MLGALMISAGFGLSAVPLAGAATAAVGLAMVLWFRRGRQQGPAAVTAEQNVAG